MTFILNPKIEADSSYICSLPLCEVRLSNNASFPWLILIPKISNLIELIDLSEENQVQLLVEIRKASHFLKKHFKAKKLNVANLGNVVAQLHIHVIARFEEDLAWPNPVWNSGISSEYLEQEKQNRINLLAQALGE